MKLHTKILTGLLAGAVGIRTAVAVAVVPLAVAAVALLVVRRRKPATVIDLTGLPAQREPVEQPAVV